MASTFFHYNGTLPDSSELGTSDSSPTNSTPVSHPELGYSTGDVAWVITASALVWLMLPGVGFFYSGLTGQKSALSMIMLSFIAMSVGAVQVFSLLFPFDADR
jgi:Ammonium Transporter Family